MNFATALGAGATVSTNNTVVLGRTADTVIAPNTLQIDVLGAAGATPLCRNAANQISTCAAASPPAESGDKQINQLRDQVKQQQIIIDGLKKFVCLQNPAAPICR